MTIRYFPFLLNHDYIQVWVAPNLVHMVETKQLFEIFCIRIIPFKMYRGGKGLVYNYVTMVVQGFIKYRTMVVSTQL